MYSITENIYCSQLGDSVDHNISILGERNWRNLALNREEWGMLLKKARAYAGLSSQL
jgi:hypothetical protein